MVGDREGKKILAVYRSGAEPRNSRACAVQPSPHPQRDRPCENRKDFGEFNSSPPQFFSLPILVSRAHTPHLSSSPFLLSRRILRFPLFLPSVFSSFSLRSGKEGRGEKTHTENAPLSQLVPRPPPPLRGREGKGFFPRPTHQNKASGQHSRGKTKTPFGIGWNKEAILKMGPFPYGSPRSPFSSLGKRGEGEKPLSPF